jgi:hypothetical protein
MMAIRSVLILSAILLPAAASAQLVINQGAENPFTYINDIKPQGEEEIIPPPSYAGSPIQLPPPCVAEDLYVPGVLCSPESPCDVFLELTSAGGASGRIFVAGDIHTSSGTVSTVLLASENDGLSWIDAGDRYEQAVLEQITFLDARNGWAPGQQTVGGVTQKPFILSTNNAGSTWRRWDIQPAGDERSAVVHEYRFDSPEHGYLILERTASETDAFELYESHNGGRAWTIREISPAKPKIPGSLRAREVSPWRVEPLPEAGVYLLQRRTEDGGWADVARFASSLGQCPHTIESPEPEAASPAAPPSLKKP